MHPEAIAVVQPLEVAKFVRELLEEICKESHPEDFLMPKPLEVAAFALEPQEESCKVRV